MPLRPIWFATIVACGTNDPPVDSAQGTAGNEATAPVDCASRPTEIPTARGEIEGGWSPAAGRFVFFGGDQGVPEQCMSQTEFVADTWVWESDCGNFRAIAGDGPARAARYAAGYDPEGDRWWIHGGRFRDGTSGPYTLRSTLWSFGFADEAWTKQSGDGPSARAIHAGAVAGGRFVIYGGTGSTDGLSYSPLYDDVWTYDLATDTWSELPTVGVSPGGRVFHAMASDGADRVFVFGGGDQNAFTGPFYADLWVLSLSSGTWTQLHDGKGPRAPDGRIWADLFHDAAGDRLLVWAGHDDTDLGNTNQLWAFDLVDQTWSQLAVGDVVAAGANGFCDFPADFVEPDLEAPERRYGAASALTDDGRLVTFGGKTDCGIINDLWTYDLTGAAWTRQLRATDGESCIRAYDDCSTLCF